MHGTAENSETMPLQISFLDMIYRGSGLVPITGMLCEAEEKEHIGKMIAQAVHVWSKRRDTSVAHNYFRVIDDTYLHNANTDQL